MKKVRISNLSLKRKLGIIFVILGAFIGAGFASGSEIYLFFYSFGIKGLIGICISSTIIFFIIFKLGNLIKKYNIKNYEEFLEIILKLTKYKNFKKTKTIILILKNMINIFLIISLFIMFAGFGAYLKQEYNINKYIGSAILCVLTFFIILNDVDEILKVNKIIVPVIIFTIFIVGIKNFENISDKIDNLSLFNNQGWIIKSILYGSYNTVLLIPLLISLKEEFKKINKKGILFISSFSAIIICVISIILFFLLANLKTCVVDVEMPILYVINEKFNLFKNIYGVIILFSIFTTSISLGIGILKNMCNNKKKYPQYAGIMCITGFIISGFGFSNLVKLLYPILGYFGIAQIIAIIFTI